ncbi:F0F1 ATP synthase subunit A [Fructobacillus durionis]|uniref:ATP synthase subunit a n=1 Tax=Fructobacillus durionis TaxID=283737 RepID=A0A1I1HEC6_9LACO|nr:F0F1 ATP synthase subunit A [Fructobacillus durionis]SFC19470.1 F-type H+-transporting ATPase subunit a [Fructobacillus durionis]
MDEPTSTFSFLGLTFTWTTVLSTLLAMTVVVLLAVFLTRKVAIRPSRGQNVIEYVLDFVRGILGDQLPSNLARQFGLYSFTLFLFLVVSNEMGLLLQVKTASDVTLIKSPTADPLIAFSLAIMSIMLANATGIKTLGLGGYLKNMFLKPYAALFPLNFVEQVTNFLTLALRLFGNIFAGELMLNLLASMAFSLHGFGWIIALPLEMAWQAFSLLIGGIQAYVFVMLTAVFTAQLSGEE